MPVKGAHRLLAMLMVMAFLLAGGVESPEGASPQKDQPSVDRLNIEDFERKPEAGKPKPKPRPQPRTPAGSPSPAETKQESQPPAAEPKAEQPPAKAAASGPLWREPLTGLEFVWIPRGCFQMGSPANEEGRRNNESEPHQVCVDGLWMGKTEVTIKAFRRFVEATGYRTEAEREGFSWYQVKNKEWGKREKMNWLTVGFGQGEDHPVVNVSYNDAKAMADWLSKQGSGAYRLPKEAEWEYGCRAGAKTARFWGDSPADACRYANVADKTSSSAFREPADFNCEDGFVHTSPVASFMPNGFGLHDMLGNVAEWCEDIYAGGKGGQQTKSQRVVESGQPVRVARGGGWRGEPRSVRCADRPPHDSVFRRAGLGFRLVRLGNPPP